jgi:hypothetical protein
MSLISMVLSPAIKDLEKNPKVEAAMATLKSAEANILPILAKLDYAAIAQEIASLSNGRITAAEVATVQAELENVFSAISALIEEATALSK